MKETPCQEDWRKHGRDWTARAETFSRQILKDMASLCHGCPVRVECERLAQEDAPYSEGMWGGFYWFQGKKIDPFGVDRGDRRSVYFRVHWDRSRGKWKAEAQRDGRKIHIGYFSCEDEAGRAAFAWQSECGDN